VSCNLTFRLKASFISRPNTATHLTQPLVKLFRGNCRIFRQVFSSRICSSISKVLEATEEFRLLIRFLTHNSLLFFLLLSSSRIPTSTIKLSRHRPVSRDATHRSIPTLTCYIHSQLQPLRRTPRETVSSAVKCKA
jgi:hypothetical protein